MFRFTRHCFLMGRPIYQINMIDSNRKPIIQRSMTNLHVVHRIFHTPFRCCSYILEADLPTFEEWNIFTLGKYSDILSAGDTE